MLIALSLNVDHRLLFITVLACGPFFVCSPFKNVKNTIDNKIKLYYITYSC